MANALERSAIVACTIQMSWLTARESQGFRDLKDLSVRPERQSFQLPQPTGLPLVRSRVLIVGSGDAFRLGQCLRNETEGAEHNFGSVRWFAARIIFDAAAVRRGT
jgi:hypothetical protein